MTWLPSHQASVPTSAIRFSLPLCFLACLLLGLGEHSRPVSAASHQEQSPFRGQSQEQADSRSAGCISCHTSEDEPTMHATKTVHLGCTDCHGGNASVSVASGLAQTSAEYISAKEKAHVQPRNGAFKNRSNLPERAYTLW